MAQRQKAARGSTPAPSRNPEPVQAEPEAAEEPVAVAPAVTGAEKQMISEIEAAGWKVKATSMSVTCTKKGFAPVHVHCSSSLDAVTLAHRNLVTDADVYGALIERRDPPADTADIAAVEAAA